MSLNAGDQITYCVLPGMQRYATTILSIDNTSILLQLPANSPAELPRGQYIMITDTAEDIDYYSEVVGREGTTLRLKRMWTGKRGYFRVDDVFPVIFKKATGSIPLLESRVYVGYTAETAELDVPDETVNPRLWSLLVDMNAKLGMILEQLHLEREGLTRAETIPVNISASGIRFALNHKTEIGDVLEIKMLLPTSPPAGIHTHGKVVHVEDLGNGRYETSFQFINLNEEVRDIIIQYTLRRQREIVRRYREQGA